jgi:hypothetical protein
MDMLTDTTSAKRKPAPLVLPRSLLLLCFAFFSAGSGAGNDCSNPNKNIDLLRNGRQIQRITIRVDPAVELFSTIHRLAGTGQYDEMLLPEYDKRVNEYFAKYQDHPAIKLAIKMRETHHINGNAPMSLACYLGAPPELMPRAPFDPPSGAPDPRWTPETISLALEAARKFARDTDFMTFFDSQKEYYELAMENLRSTMEGTDLIPWFKDYFGYLPENYVIILGLQNGSCNYGQSVVYPDGSQEFVSLLGARWPDERGAPQYLEDWFVGVVIHEFCHSYINPLVDRHRGILREAGEAIYPHVEAAMQKSGYNLWHVMMYEYLVRACTTRCIAQLGEPSDVMRQIMQDTRSGFPGMQKLNVLMEEYEADREKYPDMEAFMPRVAEFFEKFAKTFE